MTIRHNLSGIYSPVLTPFHADLSPDTQAFVRHCQWLVANDCGLAVFGTNSLSVAERRGLLEALLAAGVPPARLLPGTGCCSLTDTVELTRHATTAGVGGVLMLPPFYYKGVSDEGLFRHFAEVIERVGDSRLRIYLYHIPRVAQVPISLALIERLLKAYPTAIAGIKDSSGDWSNTEAMLKQFQPEGFDVFAGSEVFLLRTLRGGGAGCITATGNVNPAPMVNLFQSWQEGAEADAQQAALDATRAAFQKYPLISAMKSAVAHGAAAAHRAHAAAGTLAGRLARYHRISHVRTLRPHRPLAAGVAGDPFTNFWRFRQCPWQHRDCSSCRWMSLPEIMFNAR